MVIRSEASTFFSWSINSNPTEKNHFIKLGHPNFRAYRTFGQKASDFLTKWAGSWYFILGFTLFLVLWIIMNTSWIILGAKWDELTRGHPSAITVTERVLVEVGIDATLKALRELGNSRGGREENEHRVGTWVFIED